MEIWRIANPGWDRLTDFVADFGFNNRFVSPTYSTYHSYISGELINSRSHYDRSNINKSHITKPHLGCLQIFPSNPSVCEYMSVSHAHRREKSTTHGGVTKYAPMRSDSTSTVDSVNASVDDAASVFENNAMKRQLFKTKICRHHLIGRCKYSENCFFAHSVDQIARRIDFRRTKLCSKSNCRDSNCLYAHSVDEIRDPYADVCQNWINTGSCTLGNSCKFSHNLTHLEEMAIATGIKHSSRPHSASSKKDSTMSINGLQTPTACNTPTPVVPTPVASEPSAEELVQALIQMLSASPTPLPTPTTISTTHIEGSNLMF